MQQTTPRMPPCGECGRRPSARHGLCLRCDARAMVPERRMQSVTGRAAQQTWARIRSGHVSALEAAQPARVGGAEA